jgi:signal transduction histidine kinase
VDPARVFDRMTDAFLAVDENWRFTYLNERGREIVEAAADSEGESGDLHGRNLWETVPGTVDTVFQERFEEAMNDQTDVEFEAFYGPLGEWFDVRAYPSETGLSIYFRRVTGTRAREERLERQEAVLSEVHDVLARDDEPFDDKVRALLEIGRDLLDTEYGTLSHIDGDRYIFEVVSGVDDLVTEGDEAPLEATNCERTAATERALVLNDVATEAPELADRAGNSEMGISCYVGAPVYAEGTVYGTFCFYDTSPREDPFSEWEVTLVNLLAKWVSYALDRRLAEEELEAQNEKLREFTMMVSHDLRSPLSVAAGNLHLARQDHDDERLDVVADSLDRMEAIIDELLDLNHGQGSLQIAEQDLDAVARESWQQADGEGTLTVEDGLAVQADENSLRRLLENLFVNAVEHGSRNGDLHIELGGLDDGLR